jgi:hypothetical protein
MIKLRDLFEKFNLDVSHLQFEDLQLEVPENVTVEDFGPMGIGLMINQSNHHMISTFHGLTQFKQVLDVHVNLYSFHMDENTPIMTEKEIAECLFNEVCMFYNKPFDKKYKEIMSTFLQKAHSLRKK